jgi:hypothetical protein
MSELKEIRKLIKGKVKVDKSKVAITDDTGVYVCSEYASPIMNDFMVDAINEKLSRMEASEAKEEEPPSTELDDLAREIFVLRYNTSIHINKTIIKDAYEAAQDFIDYKNSKL